MTREIIFFDNGNTAVLHDGEQVPKLQRPWVQLVADLLEEQGHDPSAYRLHMPDGQTARFFRTEEDRRAEEGRWNWRFEETRDDALPHSAA